MPVRVLVYAKVAADKQVAHTTEARRNLNFVPGNESKWAIDEIERELLAVLRLFLGRVPPNRIDPDAKAGLEQLLALPHKSTGTFVAGSRAPNTQTPAQFGCYHPPS